MVLFRSGQRPGAAVRPYGSRAAAHSSSPARRFGITAAQGLLEQARGIHVDRRRQLGSASAAATALEARRAHGPRGPPDDREAAPASVGFAARASADLRSRRDLVDTVYAHVLAWQRALNEAEMSIEGWKIHRRIGMSGGLFTRAVARELGRPLAQDETEAVQAATASSIGSCSRSVGRCRARWSCSRNCGPRDSARDRHLGTPAGDRRLARGARRRRRDGGRRPRSRRPRQARARPVPHLRRADRGPAGGVLRRRGRGLGPARRTPGGHASIGLQTGGYGEDEPSLSRRLSRLPGHRGAAQLVDELGIAR